MLDGNNGSSGLGDGGDHLQQLVSEYLQQQQPPPSQPQYYHQSQQQPRQQGSAGGDLYRQNNPMEAHSRWLSE
jgi:hypothetical protein